MDSQSPSTSLTLLEQLRRPGEAGAWQRFAHLYTPLLRSWAKRRGFQEADAADLAQDVLVKLMDALPKYERRPGQSFRGWLHRVTTNQCRDFRRRTATRPMPGPDGLLSAEALDAIGEWDEREHRSVLVDQGLDLVRPEFSEQTWTAFHRMMVQGHAVPAIAADLGVTENAVFHARHRVLTRLRREIGQFLE